MSLCINRHGVMKYWKVKKKWLTKSISSKRVSLVNLWINPLISPPVISFWFFPVEGTLLFDDDDALLFCWPFWLLFLLMMNIWWSLVSTNVNSCWTINSNHSFSMFNAVGTGEVGELEPVLGRAGLREPELVLGEREGEEGEEPELEGVDPVVNINKSIASPNRFSNMAGSLEQGEGKMENNRR